MVNALVIDPVLRGRRRTAWCGRCSDIGVFPVFSGLRGYKNTIEFSGRENGPIPLGKYWIVNGPEGGIYSRFRTWQKQQKTGNKYGEWFALYRQDGFIDDVTYIDGRRRGSFRLHPLRPDGSGVSDGCITFCNRSDFYKFRSALLTTNTSKIHCSGLVAFGEVNVMGMPYAK